MVKHLILIFGVIIIIIVIVVVITYLTYLTSSTPSTQLPPTQLTITWLNKLGIASYSDYVPQNGIYILTTDTSLESYDIGVSYVLSILSPGLTVQQIYKINGYYTTAPHFDASANNIVFIKYMDLKGTNRFTLVVVLTASTIITITTTDDVGTLIDPTKYTGKWTTYTNSNNSFISDQLLTII